MKILNANELRNMRTPKALPVGTIIEWEETLCRYRGTYKNRRIKVLHIDGKNIEDTHGGSHYWTDLKQQIAIKATLPCDLPSPNPNQEKDER